MCVSQRALHSGAPDVPVWHRENAKQAFIEWAALRWRVFILRRSLVKHYPRRSTVYVYTY